MGAGYWVLTKAGDDVTSSWSSTIPAKRNGLRQTVLRGLEMTINNVSHYVSTISVQLQSLDDVLLDPITPMNIGG